MLVFYKKRIVLVLIMVLVSLYAFLLEEDIELKEIVDVSADVSEGKTIVVDARSPDIQMKVQKV